jgi:hypothetical protein
MLVDDGFNIILAYSTIHNAFRINQYTRPHHTRPHATGVGQSNFIEQITGLNFIHELVHDICATTAGTGTARVALRPVLGADEYMFIGSWHGFTPLVKTFGNQAAILCS